MCTGKVLRECEGHSLEVRCQVMEGHKNKSRAAHAFRVLLQVDIYSDAHLTLSRDLT